MTNIFGDMEYSIGEELHENGTKHYHAWIKAAKAFETTNVHKFDIKGVHPNIINPGKGWEAYCVKDKKFITNHWKDCNFAQASRKTHVAGGIGIPVGKRAQVYAYIRCDG